MEMKVRPNRMSRVEVYSTAKTAWGAVQAYARQLGMHYTDEVPHGGKVLVTLIQAGNPNMGESGSMYDADIAARWLFDVFSNELTEAHQRAAARVFLAVARQLVAMLDEVVDPAYQNHVSRTGAMCCDKAVDVFVVLPGGRRETIGKGCSVHTCPKCKRTAVESPPGGPAKCRVCGAEKEAA